CSPEDDALRIPGCALRISVLAWPVRIDLVGDDGSRLSRFLEALSTDQDRTGPSLTEGSQS
ncbi:MAG: hypothetical protein ABSG53_15665, partial [Thermoguttaceae bacterium]